MAQTQQIDVLNELQTKVLNLEQKNKLLTVRVETLSNKIENFETWRTKSSIAIFQFQKWYAQQQQNQTPYHVENDAKPEWSKRDDARFRDRDSQLAYLKG